ncbi:MAG: DUF2062 domain-containing protein [Desulfuromonadaceae bacterium]|nr:DUF2062 domain-containing protein [Desulfuromonadaceae bacterium]
MSIMTEFDVVATPQSKPLWRLMASPVLNRLQGVMTCGLTPQKLALTLCVGTAIGILPLLWGTSLLCILLAHLLKLNQVALQSVNYLLYPLQLALLVPFFKLGAWLFPWGASIPPDMLSTVMNSPGSSLHLLGWILLNSLAAWLVTALPAALTAYGILMAVASKKRTHMPGA